MQTLKLIFGQLRGMYGTLEVSPELMLVLLSKPFKEWLKKKTWEETGFENKQGDFDEEVYATLEVYNDGGDFDVHPSEFSWQGFRIDYEQSDAAAEIVFARDRVVGEIHLNHHKINGELYNKVVMARGLLNEIQTPFKK